MGSLLTICNYCVYLPRIFMSKPPPKKTENSWLTRYENIGSVWKIIYVNNQQIHYTNVGSKLITITVLISDKIDKHNMPYVSSHFTILIYYFKF